MVYPKISLSFSLSKIVKYKKGKPSNNKSKNSKNNNLSKIGENEQKNNYLIS